MPEPPISGQRSSMTGMPVDQEPAEARASARVLLVDDLDRLLLIHALIRLRAGGAGAAASAALSARRSSVGGPVR